MYDLVKLLDHLYNFFPLIIYYQLVLKEGKAISVEFSFRLGGHLKIPSHFPF